MWKDNAFAHFGRIYTADGRTGVYRGARHYGAAAGEEKHGNCISKLCPVSEYDGAGQHCVWSEDSEIPETENQREM